MMMVAGVLIGSALWWLILSAGVSVIKHKISTDILQVINRISGVVIFVFGILALLSLFQ